MKYLKRYTSYFKMFYKCLSWLILFSCILALDFKKESIQTTNLRESPMFHISRLGELHRKPPGRKRQIFDDVERLRLREQRPIPNHLKRDLSPKPQAFYDLSGHFQNSLSKVKDSPRSRQSASPSRMKTPQNHLDVEDYDLWNGIETKKYDGYLGTDDLFDKPKHPITNEQRNSTDVKLHSLSPSKSKRENSPSSFKKHDISEHPIKTRKQPSKHLVEERSGSKSMQDRSVTQYFKASETSQNTKDRKFVGASNENSPLSEQEDKIIPFKWSDPSLLSIIVFSCIIFLSTIVEIFLVTRYIWLRKQARQHGLAPSEEDIDQHSEWEDFDDDKPHKSSNMIKENFASSHLFSIE